MSKRESFLQSVCRVKIEDFLNFIKMHRDVAEPFDLCEVLQELSQGQLDELWARMVSLLTDTLVAYPTERWDAGLADDSEDEMEVEVSSDMNLTMSILEGVIVVATASVSVVQASEPYKTLLDCVNILNDLLPAVPPAELQLQLSIIDLCELWWHAGLQGRNELGQTAFIRSLERTLMLKNPGKELDRLWSLHDVLFTLHFESAAGKEVAELLLQCFLSVGHIKREKGHRFLSFLFSWNVNFIKMIHGTIKNQLQFFPKQVVEHVADIYFRAWKDASGVFLEEIENSCIQDFMQHGILVHRSSPVHAKVRQILSHIHKQKLRQGVDEMLFRLYKPILWRGLKATNGEVRANATLLFTEAFPIHKPGVNCEKLDEAIQQQLDMLFSLLQDPQPLVRSTAVLGVCKILAKYWDMFPPVALTDLLKKIILELASDVNSADVRCSVFKCMAVILDNSLSHPLLEQFIPALNNSLHDNSEKVRVAFVDLLVKIKAVRAAKFWKVCSVDHLLARLELDSRPVAQRLVTLLFNSFFPINQSEEVWCERCVTLIQMNPAAARKFYQYTYKHTAPTNVAKLMLTIQRCLNACIQSSRAEERNGAEDTNKENISVLEDVLSTKDTATMASLLEIVVILWRSIHRALEHNQEAKQYTISKFASVLPEYFRVFQDNRCTVPLMMLASFMPAAAVPTFSCGVVSRLRRLEAGAESSQYGMLLDCLCSWGQAGHVLELITDWLTDALPQETGQGTRGSARRVRIERTEEAKPDLGLQYLEYMLAVGSTRTSLLGLNTSRLNHLLKTLWAWKSVLLTSLGSAEASPDHQQVQVETALKAFALHGHLSIHLQHTFAESREHIQVLENSAVWVIEKVVSCLVSPELESQQQQQALARRVVETCLTTCKNVIMVGLSDDEFSRNVLDLCGMVLLSDGGYRCVPQLLCVLKETAADCLERSVRAHTEQLDLLLGIFSNLFHKLLEVMARKVCKQPEEGLQVCQTAMANLGTLLNTVHDWKAAHPESINGIFSSMFAAMIVEIKYFLLKISSADQLSAVPETVQELPSLSSCLLSVILKSPHITRSFLTEASSAVDSEAIEGVAGLAAVIHVLSVVRHAGKCRADVKNVAVSIQKQLPDHHGLGTEENRSVERAIYESAVSSLNQLLML